MTSHPFSALSGQMSCEASAPAWSADRAQSLWSDTNLGSTRGQTWVELVICSWTATIPCLAADPARQQLNITISTNLQMAGSTNYALIGAYNRKNPICTPPKRMKHTKQSSCTLLLAEQQRAALCHSLARWGFSLEPCFQNTFVSISYNSKLPTETHSKTITAFFCQYCLISPSKLSYPTRF